MIKNDHIKGITYGHDARRGSYRTRAAKESLIAALDLEVNYVCLAFTVYVEKFSSTDIFFDYRGTVTDSDLFYAISAIKARGKAVFLRPMLGCRDGASRQDISFPDFPVTENGINYWNEWFHSYTAFIRHYAEIAEDAGVELFCIGSELTSTERHAECWRNIIMSVRNIYSGQLIYSANAGGESKIRWWELLDYIGIVAYPEIGNEATTGVSDIERSIETLVREWEIVARRYESAALQYNKHIIFTESGCRSVLGAASRPWDYLAEAVANQQEQAAFIDTCLAVMTRKSWFKGVFWWGWTVESYPPEHAEADVSYNIRYKMAERILKRWNLK